MPDDGSKVINFKSFCVTFSGPPSSWCLFEIIHNLYSLHNCVFFRFLVVCMFFILGCFLVVFLFSFGLSQYTKLVPSSISAHVNIAGVSVVAWCVYITVN